MSTDYYLVCKSKRLYMPIFTMTMGKVWCAQPEWVFDFTLATSGEPVEYLSEHAVHDLAEDDGNTLIDEGWTFMNAWHPYKGQGTKNT